MKLIGFETSSAVCSVACIDSGKLFAQRSITQQNIHSESLLPMLDDVLHEAGVPMADVEGVAVSIGPGSFTGLRIGLSTAKGLCFARNIPMTAVPTFDVVAASVAELRPDVNEIFLAVDAKRGEFYHARYRLAAGGFEAVVPVTADLLPGTPGAACVVTDRVELLKSRWPEAEVLDLHAYCSGAVVARLGLKRLESGERVDWRSLEPMYLKDFVATSTPKKLF